MAASERRIVELVLKAVGDEEIKRIARDMGELKKVAQESQNQLDLLNKSFLGVSAAAAGAFIGNKIQEGISALISTVSEAVTEMNELAEAGKAAGSGLSSAAVGGAVELSKAVAELSAELDKATKEFVGGLAPALTLIVKQLSAAAGGMDGFYEAGQAVGRLLVDQVGQFNKAIATLGAYANAAMFAAQTVTSAYNAWSAALSGNLDLSDKWMKSAQAAAKAAAIYATSAQEIGRAAYNATQAQYQGEQAAARRTGFGGGTATGGKGGSKSSADRASSTRKETEELSLYEKTMQMVNVQLVELSNAFQKADQERQKFVENIPKMSNDEWERQAQEQAAALEKLQQEWGGVADAMGQATYDIISGTESIGQAVKKMVATIVADLVRLQLTKLAQKFLGGLFGGIDFMSASGNAFGASGLITGPTLHTARGGGIGIAGENGPEAILPLRRNASGQLGVAAGGASNVTVNNYTGAQVAVSETDQGLQIDLVERQLADRVRRGGSPLPGAIENTYRSGRFASAY